MQNPEILVEIPLIVNLFNATQARSNQPFAPMVSFYSRQSSHSEVSSGYSETHSVSK